ncbi:hypothetical protein DRV85_09505 [Rhodosalinus halophilus]|uniref:Uncharacterized protein n=1 Tax=Rhodosalinus halophilus TaxID=2259333 RepID=A0A365U845_9RHOB|nr:H-type lectin domain-containing protein [Rhodosalinus halophilus]RBI84900.1 hypothetical protein DRV85_09505 [Rhodosalinus halophilus]
MATSYTSTIHVFSLDDIAATFGGLTFADDPTNVDTAAAVVTPYEDKDGNLLYGVDSEFGFYVQDFVGAEQKVLDGDFGEGFAGNIYDETDPTQIVGLALRNSPTEIFKSGAPLGTWSLGLGGMTVKASTEHYNTMAQVLSDQAFPEDADALAPLDNDLRLLDLRPTGPDGTFEAGAVHQLWVEELSQALQAAMDNVGNPDQVLSDIDFDRDGVNDTYRITTETVQFDSDDDGIPESIDVGAVDLGDDGSIDLIDKWLNGFGGEADVVDLLEPNEATTAYDIAYSQDYSITLKDDGKLLYRWGEAVKRPNDLRLEVNMELPEEWTRDDDDNGVADWVENGSAGFYVHRAELIINHEITNNPNDQIRPEDYENEAAIGRLPSYYVVRDPADASNTLWVSPRDSYNGEGTFLPSYFRLTETGEIDMVAQPGDVAVTDPDGNVVGFRNKDAMGNLIGTVFRDLSLADAAATADLTFDTEDLSEGFTANWYTTVDREPFEWSYDKFADDPYKQVFESFRSREDAEAAGYSDDELVSGPRWRLTPNKFGQDLPGLEVPLTPNTKPPYQRDNIKYPTGEDIVTKLNLLDWEGESPLKNSAGWMLVDPERLDENSDGLIDEGWSKVNGTLGAGDALPTGPILSAVSPNGLNLTHEFFDTSVYVKGDRQDSTQLYDMQLVIEYAEIETIGSVQKVLDLDHNEQFVTYQNGHVFDSAVVFVTPPTLNGSDASTVTVTEVTDTGAHIFIEEADHHDGIHSQDETVTMLTFEEGAWNLEDGTRMEVGTQIVPGGPVDSFYTVTFAEAFEDIPTVVVQLQTDNGEDWAIARVRNVTETGFQFAIQEEEAGDGIHYYDEILGWFAIDPADDSGNIDLGDVMAQAFSTTASHEAGSFTFDSDIGLDPLISAGISTYNGPDPAVLRLAELTNDGTAATAEFIVQEERSNDVETWHMQETVSGVAFDQAGLLTGYEALDTFAFV